MKVKLPEENVQNEGPGKRLLDMTPETQSIKEKVNWMSSKFKSFCAVKDPIKRMKRYPTAWE